MSETMMRNLMKPIADWGRGVAGAWDRFWFAPEEPHALALIRILGGAMLFYTHLVWAIDLEAFLGPNAWVTADTARFLNQGPTGNSYAWSYLYYIESPALLWTVHLAALVVFAMLTAGLFTRVTSILSFIITISYCHRLTPALFGLDQVNSLIATYLMVGHCGAVYSLDRWRANRSGRVEPIGPTVSTNVAIRLIQLHMCVIYLFGGIGKMRGETWWDGRALWFAFANLEYQSIDMTWMVHLPWLVSLLTHITVFWETFYCFLIWPKLTRPVCLIMAILVHLGIAFCLGMQTFGLAMIIGNIAFVSPAWVQATVRLLSRPFARPQKAAPRATAATHMVANL